MPNGDMIALLNKLNGYMEVRTEIAREQKNDFKEIMKDQAEILDHLNNNQLRHGEAVKADHTLIKTSLNGWFRYLLFAVLILAGVNVTKMAGIW